MRKPLLFALSLCLITAAEAKPINKPANAATVTTLPYSLQQTAPEPTGGVDALNRYMKKYANHQYNNEQEGTVTLSFIVKKDGTISDYKVVHSLNKEADGITIAVLKDYNQKWKPAMKDGQPVDAPYSIEVPFGK